MAEGRANTNALKWAVAGVLKWMGEAVLEERRGGQMVGASEIMNSTRLYLSASGSP